MRSLVVLSSLAALCIGIAAHRIVQIPPMWDRYTSELREEVRSGCMKTASYTLSTLAVFDRFMKEAAKKWREAGMLEESELFLALNAHAQNRSPLVNAIGCR